MAKERVQRLLSLVSLLQTGRSLNPETIAQELGVSKRTVFRDLSVLESAGLRMTFDHSRQSYRAGDSMLPPVAFTFEESLALLTLTRKMLNRLTVSNYRAMVRAAAKVESMLPPGIRQHCGAALKKLDFRWGPVCDASTIAGLTEMVHRAAINRTKLAIDYDSYLERENIATVLHPYRVVFITRAWYVIGFSERHQEVRTFKVERIVQAKPTDAPFDMPADFDLGDYFGNAWQMIRGARRHHIVIRFAPKVAGNVEEVLWHKTQQTVRLPDGSLRFEADVDGLEEISYWVMGYADYAQVIEPAELAALIHQRARNLCRMYDNGSPAPWFCEEPDGRP